MIHIVINGAETGQVLEWSQRVIRMATGYTDAGKITFSGEKRDGAGGYEAYVTVVITGEPAEAEGQRQVVVRTAPVDPAGGASAGDDVFRQIEIYTTLGQLWGLAEVILGEVEPNVTDLLEEHVWGTIGPNRIERIRGLFDSLPQDYVLSAVRQAKEEERITGHDMLSYPGLYWPGVFVRFVQVMPDTKNGQAIIREFINPNPLPIVRTGD